MTNPETLSELPFLTFVCWDGETNSPECVEEAENLHFQARYLECGWRDLICSSTTEVSQILDPYANSQIIFITENHQPQLPLLETVLKQANSGQKMKYEFSTLIQARRKPRDIIEAAREIH